MRIYFVILLIISIFVNLVGLLDGWTKKNAKVLAPTKKDRFVCWIMVPPYIRQYLLINYKVDDPDWPCMVNIRSDEYLFTLFRSRLIKPSHRYDNRIENNCKYHNRSCKIAIEISKDDFYNHGWSLSSTDESTLVRAMEVKAHTMVLTFLASAYMVNPVLKNCIDNFYRLYEFDENSWPSDSIRRLWNRSNTINKVALKNELITKINEIVIGKLFQSGTISQKAKENYENNQF